MKKVFLTVLTVGFLASVMVSCQSEAKKDSADSTAVIQKDSTKVADSLAAIPVIEPTKEEIKQAEVIKAPVFTNPEINDGFNEFNSLKTEYAEALASKDKEAVDKVVAKRNAWVMKTAAYGSKLPSDEVQNYIDYYQKLNRQWDIVGRQGKKK